MQKGGLQAPCLPFRLISYFNPGPAAPSPAPEQNETSGLGSLYGVGSTSAGAVVSSREHGDDGSLYGVGSSSDGDPQYGSGWLPGIRLE